MNKKTFLLHGYQNLGAAASSFPYAEISNPLNSYRLKKVIYDYYILDTAANLRIPLEQSVNQTVQLDIQQVGPAGTIPFAGAVENVNGFTSVDVPVIFSLFHPQTVEFADIELNAPARFQLVIQNMDAVKTIRIYYSMLIEIEILNPWLEKSAKEKLTAWINKRNMIIIMFFLCFLFSRFVCTRK